MTAQEMIRRYGIRDGANYGHAGKIVPTYIENVEKDGKKYVLELLTANKAEIQKILEAEKAAKEEEARKRKERQARINAIPGLQEIRDAQNAFADYHDRFRRSFEGEYAVGGMGIGQKPDVDIDALKMQYPMASAYLKMEKKALSDNYELSEIGQKAIDALLDGTPYAAALEQMETDLKAFTERHLWD